MMTRDEFFKEAMVYLFGSIILKNECSFSWKNKENSYVIEIEKNTFDYYIRIYDNKIIVISSKDRYKFWNSDFNVDEFKKYFTKMFNDNDPF